MSVQPFAQGGYSPAAKYATIGLCTTAVLGCGLALWYRRQAAVRAFGLSSGRSLNSGKRLSKLQPIVPAAEPASTVRSRLSRLLAQFCRRDCY